MNDKKRRRSLNIFRPRAESPSSIDYTQVGLSSLAESRPTTAHTNVNSTDGGIAATKTRPRTLQKGSRTSVFGSLRSLQDLDEEEKAHLTRSDSKESSLHEETLFTANGLFGNIVQCWGEVQTFGSSVFRKRCQTLVLTESHLVRFKSQAKAAEVFPTIPATPGRGYVSRSSMSSVGSNTDLQSSIYGDITQGLPLDQVVAVYRADDGRSAPAVEIASLDERSYRTAGMHLLFNEARDAETWVEAIRAAAADARQVAAKSTLSHTVDHVAKLLERERDLDPWHMKIFPVVQRASTRPTGRASSEDLAKQGNNVCYLAIGINKVHVIPLPRTSNPSSATSLSDADVLMSFGITTLTAIRLQQNDDSFSLQFSVPLQTPRLAALASVASADIARWLKYASEFLRPEWTIQPFTLDAPDELDDHFGPPEHVAEDNNCFDRTLIAYCAAFDVDTSRICYAVDYECEDAPCFRLLPSATGSDYSPLELLAVLRALRYNESFVSISFANINLRALRTLHDPNAEDADGCFTRSGLFVNLPGHAKLPLLSQEIRALAVKSRRLRRLDFSRCMSTSVASAAERRHSGIPEALAPLCKKSLTNVDWVVLSGIKLADADLDFLVDMASERQCHIRGLELGDCGLSVHDIDVLLSTLAVHESTVEAIDVSGAQGRFSPELFGRSISPFSRIRQLDLTRVQKTAGAEPLVAPEVLLCWRLESLRLSQTMLNEQTVDMIAAYLTSPKSDTLRELQLNQCGLTGKDLALFLHAMTREAGTARNMHLSASENRLGIGMSALSRSIRHNQGPSSLTLRMMDFETEHQFRELVYALTLNTTLRSLDISRASLPYDASIETCEALKDMFAKNQTLETLDISGEHAHLDAARFGIGLNLALLGLEKNRSLKLLRIEHQGLGLQGANTLAGVLEANTSLLEIHCDRNDLNLQSFTVLVNALQKNTTILYLPDLRFDKVRSLEKFKDELSGAGRDDEPKSPKIGSLKRSWTGLAQRGPWHHHRHSSSVSGGSNVSFSDLDLAATIDALEDKWYHQASRMQQYLLRNYHLANGTACDDKGGRRKLSNASGQRPRTADSLATMLARIDVDRTPTAERDVSPLAVIDGKLTDRRVSIFQLPED